MFLMQNRTSRQLNRHIEQTSTPYNAITVVKLSWLYNTAYSTIINHKTMIWSFLFLVLQCVYLKYEVLQEAWTWLVVQTRFWVGSHYHAVAFVLQVTGFPKLCTDLNFTFLHILILRTYRKRTKNIIDRCLLPGALQTYALILFELLFLPEPLF